MLLVDKVGFELEKYECITQGLKSAIINNVI